MSSFILFQFTRKGKFLLTKWACEWLLASMSSFMLFQFTKKGKFLLTLWACEWLFTSMSSFMLFQFTRWVNFFSHYEHPSPAEFYFFPRKNFPHSPQNKFIICSIRWTQPKFLCKTSMHYYGVICTDFLHLQWEGVGFEMTIWFSKNPNCLNVWLSGLNVQYIIQSGLLTWMSGPVRNPYTLNIYTTFQINTQKIKLPYIFENPT